MDDDGIEELSFDGDLDVEEGHEVNLDDDGDELDENPSSSHGNNSKTKSKRGSKFSLIRTRTERFKSGWIGGSQDEGSQSKASQSKTSLEKREEKEIAAELSSSASSKGRYNINEMVLVQLHNLNTHSGLYESRFEFQVPNGCNDFSTVPDIADYIKSISTSAPVNKMGYPEGQGKTTKERKGPFMYVLCYVKSLHFWDHAIYYTVVRCDTGTSQRADIGWMHTIDPESGGLTAARRAAETKSSSSRNVGGNRSVPSFKVYRQFTFYIILPIWRAICSIGRFIKTQAKNIVHGKRPYHIEIHFTSVNFLVLCSLIYNFLDSLALAYSRSRDAIIVLNWICFAVAIILTMELIAEFIAMPFDIKGFLSEKNDDQYSPKQARHLDVCFFTGELLALVFYWINIFFTMKEAQFYAPWKLTLDDQMIKAVFGPSYLDSFTGYAYFVVVRLRMFNLIRHWRNYRVSKIVRKVERITSSQENEIMIKNRMRGSEAKQTHEINELDFAFENNMIAQAPTISNALVVVNTHRIIFLVVFISLFFPFIVWVSSAGPHRSFYEMTKYLHDINKGSGDDCTFLGVSTYSWLGTQNYGGTINCVILNPVRCEFQLEDGLICDPTYEFDNLEYGTILYNMLEDSGFKTETAYNTFQAVNRANQMSVFIQLGFSLLVLGILATLYQDAHILVIKQIRGMLNIVIQYGKNPLASTQMDEKISGGSLASTQKKLRKFYLKRHGVHSGDKKIGSFETERLITAISKITDLLRKCWGVAGAGIISANLARNPTGDTVVFNPTVPGKLVYAIFAFVGISDFAHLLSCLKEEIMDVINDVARVVHSEVFRWGFGNSGQCNKNLGPCFLISYRIGEVKEVQRKKAKAAEVIFKDSNRKTQSNMKSRKSRAFVDVSDDVTNLQLSSLPGIQEFTDRALLGMIKSFAGINRDEHVMKWSNHFSLGSGVGAFSVELLFGMHAGWAVEGAVGSGYKIDATYLSPHVNTASRMMGACKQYRVSLLMSQAVEELLSDEARKEVRHIDTITVKGSVVPQRIYTFDARHKGVSFFLNQRTDEVADEDAEHYTPNIWLSDRDITDMKSHITPEFESTFKAGLKLYFEGKWKDAIAKLSYADKILFDNVLEADLMSEFDRRMDDMKELRHQLGDGPSQVLIKYMESHNGIAPKDWNGVHKLTAK